MLGKIISFRVSLGLMTQFEAAVLVNRDQIVKQLLNPECLILYF
ncbi:hypothetical protein AHMF7616_00430 [Adhaeribacter pallidiroseus]|uniref:Uncharacterized protein n=1 Tax=Adhaeribacter pallidiroseus TaxID=2072847 RepID=A0A369QAB3_9BACT|nr:hypothetical protein AHMF7616_00430 [Adhaeribacter pallidiroseus]